MAYPRYAIAIRNSQSRVYAEAIFCGVSFIDAEVRCSGWLSRLSEFNVGRSHHVFEDFSARLRRDRNRQFISPLTD